MIQYNMKVKVIMDDKKHRKVPSPEVGGKFTDQSDLVILAQTVAGEAEGESYEGKLAVAYVAMNRVGDKRWPPTASEVVLQKWQFSCFNAGSPRIKPMMQPEKYIGAGKWEECFRAAASAMFGLEPDPTFGANHYLVTSIRDRTSWSQGKTPTVEIDNHSFYKLAW